jgi:hypothetical protein
MARPPSSPAVQELLVQSDAATIGALREFVDADPEAALLQHIAPDAVVLSASPDAQQRLRARFGSRLLIEPNADLTPPG